MKITIESTDTITYYNGNRVRVWKGVTERGIECGLFIAGLAVHESKDASQFEAELQETRGPDELRTPRQVFDMRMF